jgi:YbgC/YbaW family acyl-CoA thioester hydrolase
MDRKDKGATDDPVRHSRFVTELQVRPDDIDMNRHVHNSRYFDFVLAARYDQMERCYKMPMEEFVAKGYGWVVRTAHVEWRRPLGLGDKILITTWIDEVQKHGVKVGFEIKHVDGWLSCRGYFQYVMIMIETGTLATIPEDVVRNYSI